MEGQENSRWTTFVTFIQVHAYFKGIMYYMYSVPSHHTGLSFTILSS